MLRSILVFVMAGVVYLARRKMAHDDKAFPWWAATLAAAVGYFIFYLLLKFSQYNAFSLNAYDFSVFQYALHSLGEGEFFRVAFWDASFFREHFSPILLIIWPLYGLVKHGAVLLVLQATAVVVAVWPLYRICRHVFQDPEMGFWFSLVYLGHWHLVHGLLYDFHVEMFLPFIIFMLLDAFIRRQRRLWIYLILALMCKEDVAVYLFGFGLLAGVHSHTRRIGFIMMAICAGWLIMALGIIGFFDGRGWDLWGYRFFGNWSMHEPFQINIRAFWQLLAPFAGLPFFHFWGLASLVPLAVNLSSHNPLQSNLMLYYAVPVLPFIFWGAIYGLRQIMQWSPKRLRPIMSALLTAYLVVFNLHHYHPEPVLDRHRIGRMLIRSIPHDCSIACQGNLVPQFGYSRFLKVLPHIPKNAQWILLDMEGNGFPMTQAQRIALLEKLKADPEYKKKVDQSGFMFFEHIPGDK